MPYNTQTVLRRAAGLLDVTDLHTGEQFANPETGALDLCAAIYWAAHSTERLPEEFFTDETTTLATISASADTMAAIRALSGTLPTQPSYTEIVAGHQVPEYIEHVSNWAATTPVFGEHPPTVAEVIGALLRAAQVADLATVPAQRAAA